MDITSKEPAAMQAFVGTEPTEEFHNNCPVGSTVGRSRACIRPATIEGGTRTALMSQAVSKHGLVDHGDDRGARVSV